MIRTVRKHLLPGRFCVRSVVTVNILPFTAPFGGETYSIAGRIFGGEAYSIAERIFGGGTYSITGRIFGGEAYSVEGRILAVGPGTVTGICTCGPKRNGV